MSDLPEPERVRSLLHCAAEQFPHTLYLQHTQRVVSGLLGFIALTRLSAGWRQSVPHRSTKITGQSFLPLTLTNRKCSSLRTSALLRFDQSCGSVYTHNQTARDLRVERPAVTCLLHSQDPPDPCHHLVRRRVCRFVQVNEPRPNRNQEVH